MADWSHDLDPPTVRAWLDQIEFVESVLAVLLSPQIARSGIEGHPEAVADAVGEELLDVRSNLATYRSASIEKRTILWGCAVVVEPKDYAGEVGVIWLGADRG